MKEQDIPALQPQDSIRLGNIVKCTGCNEEIIAASIKCPYCGEPRKPKRDRG